MGDDKNEAEWLKKAKSEGWRCGVCGNTPPYEDREMYLQTGMCGDCALSAADDD